MTAYTKEILVIMLSMDMEFYTTPMENNTRGNLSKTNFKGMGNSFGPTEKNSRDSGKTTKKKVSASTHPQTQNFATLVSGKKTSNMASAPQ
jgi:hypothetical protein